MCVDRLCQSGAPSHFGTPRLLPASSPDVHRTSVRALTTPISSFTSALFPVATGATSRKQKDRSRPLFRSLLVVHFSNSYLPSFHAVAHSLKNWISRKPLRICRLRTLLQKQGGRGASSKHFHLSTSLPDKSLIRRAFCGDAQAAFDCAQAEEAYATKRALRFMC